MQTGRRELKLTISRRKMASCVSSVVDLRAAVADGIARCDSMANRFDELFWWANSRPLRLFGSGGKPGSDILERMRCAMLRVRVHVANVAVNKKKKKHDRM